MQQVVQKSLLGVVLSLSALIAGQAKAQADDLARELEPGSDLTGHGSSTDAYEVEPGEELSRPSGFDTEEVEPGEELALPELSGRPAVEPGSDLLPRVELDMPGDVQPGTDLLIEAAAHRL
jgi:hypothetical protein